MEQTYDAETVAKIELINRKVEEINQRRLGIHTTNVEDELDHQELEAYIKTLNLTDRQRQIVEQHSRDVNRPLAGSRFFYFLIMSVGVILQLYIAYEIFRITAKGAPGTQDLVYLGLLASFFTFNMFQLLRYLRVFR